MDDEEEMNRGLRQKGLVSPTITTQPLACDGGVIVGPPQPVFAARGSEHGGPMQQGAPWTCCCGPASECCPHAAGNNGFRFVGSPGYGGKYAAPHAKGYVREADFDWGETLLVRKMGLGAMPQLEWESAGAVRVALESDVDGLVADMKAMARCNVCCGLVLALNPLFLCHSLLCPNHFRTKVDDCCPNCESQGCGPYTIDAKDARATAAAHRLKLLDDCVVYERDEHETTVTKNWIGNDQYGHRFSGVSFERDRVVAARVTVPLRHADVSVVPIAALGRFPREVSGCVQCCSPCLVCIDGPSANWARGSIVVVRAALDGGVQLTVACVDVGANSNAQQFVKMFEEAKVEALELDASLESAYSEWFSARLSRAGTMTYAAPVAPGAGVPVISPGVSHERGEGAWQGPHYEPVYVKSVGPFGGSVGATFEARATKPLTGSGHGLDAEDVLLQATFENGHVAELTTMTKEDFDVLVDTNAGSSFNLTVLAKAGSPHPCIDGEASTKMKQLPFLLPPEMETDLPPSVVRDSPVTPAGTGGTEVSVAVVVDPKKSLTDLKELFDAGIITQADFDSKKAELLARM